MRISDWSSDVCSSDLRGQFHRGDVLHPRADLCADLLASVDGRMDDDAASERLVAVERRFPTRTEVVQDLVEVLLVGKHMGEAARRLEGLLRGVVAGLG